MTPRTEAACDEVEQLYKSVSSDSGDRLPTPPPLSSTPDEPSKIRESHNITSRIFAKSRLFALTFHVLEGPKQRMAEMNITVRAKPCPSCRHC